MSLSNAEYSLLGLTLSHGGLKLLKDRNSIVRLDSDPKDAKVKLISGGGSGHEPAHAGYVGHGMLSGAVCGDVFTSPPVAAIEDCLRAVADRNSDVIFIVKNYTGDRLNFGNAMEMAQATYGFKRIRMLLVGEDCSIEDERVSKSVGKRGLAGVVLVHKILGAMAESGMAIEEVYNFGEGLIASGNLATIGFTFDLEDNKLKDVEIGKGIHGEPGVYTMKTCKDFEEIIDFIIGKLVAKVPEKTEVILLVNNLGGTSEFLMNIFLDGFLNKIEPVYGVKRIYSGAYLTSLNQVGISVTVLNNGYSPDLLKYLDYNVSVASALFGTTSRFALPPSKVVNVGSSKPLKMTTYSNACSFSSDFGAKLASTIVVFVCEALISSKRQLNDIDRELGDGDTGSTIAKGAAAILENLKSHKLNLQYPGVLLQQISIILQYEMGGSSGALYSLFFQGAASSFLNRKEGDQAVGIEHWSQALSNGNDKIVQYAYTQLGDRTMLDALRGGEQRLKQAIAELKKVRKCIQSFTIGCEKAARATKDMVPKSGRAAYAASSGSSKTYKNADPGAHAVSTWARALFEACKQLIPAKDDDEVDKEDEDEDKDKVQNDE